MTTHHGWQACRACHAPGFDVRVEGDWHLRANPGYWGTSAPKTLVLGFSKGATQIAAAQHGSFDGVAFAGAMRPRLAAVLHELGIDLGGQTIDDALTAESHHMGAASLVRCGLSVMEKAKLVSSGTIMPKAMRSSLPLEAMKTCVARHLDPLPDSVERVVLLGTTDAYVKGVKALMRQQFIDFQDLNDVAFRAQGRTWVFASHPSPANGTFQAWIYGDAATEPGRKKQLALQALGHKAPAQHLPPAPCLAPQLIQPSTPPVPISPAKASNDDRFARAFHLVRHDGRVIVPVRMRDRDTGNVAFRVAKMGNTKDGQREIYDEVELLRLCESGQCQVRAQPLDKSTPANFVRPLLNHRIVKTPAH
ncbi:hypothetical protein HH110_04565 [Stenotrophomonas sp. SAM-B]|uniref:hypothetical protein n=1 Tax=Stenotrophomonas sp. SAM-B TaxID=2729141 RepID=UPI0015A334F7|nr:hypothetical protein [Stenotrophomonas sp. SAM-B]NWF32319.1 hypothetical protein [Stenotrophomonas sp. SAM-B]